MIRIFAAFVCAVFGAAEQWILGQTVGDMVVGAFALGFGFILCSPRATSPQSLLKVAALLLGLVLAADLVGLAVTSVIDGRASPSSGTWMLAVIGTWLLLDRPKMSQWVGIQPTSGGVTNG